MRNFKILGSFLAVVLILTAAKIGLKRNQVHGERDEPLAGAYVAVLTDDGRLFELRTDARGRFRLPLPILDDTTGQMVICARGHVPVLTRPSGAWESGWGLRKGPRRLSPSLREEGWTGPTPPECGDQTPWQILLERERRAERERKRLECGRRAAVQRVSNG